MSLADQLQESIHGRASLAEDREARREIVHAMKGSSFDERVESLRRVPAYESLAVALRQVTERNGPQYGRALRGMTVETFVEEIALALGKVEAPTIRAFELHFRGRLAESMLFPGNVDHLFEACTCSHKKSEKDDDEDEDDEPENEEGEAG